MESEYEGFIAQEKQKLENLLENRLKMKRPFKGSKFSKKTMEIVLNLRKSKLETIEEEIETNKFYANEKENGRDHFIAYKRTQFIEPETMTQLSPLVALDLFKPGNLTRRFEKVIQKAKRFFSSKFAELSDFFETGEFVLDFMKGGAFTKRKKNIFFCKLRHQMQNTYGVKTEIKLSTFLLLHGLTKEKLFKFTWGDCRIHGRELLVDFKNSISIGKYYLNKCFV